MGGCSSKASSTSSSVENVSIERLDIEEHDKMEPPVLCWQFQEQIEEQQQPQLPPLPPLVLPDMMLINLDVLRKEYMEFPSFSTCKEKLVSLRVINMDESFVIYVSHSWIRPANESSTAHPDNSSHEKFRLLIEGFDRFKAQYLQSGIVVWVYIDYSCCDTQNKIDEISNDSIAEAFISRIKYSDCIFTPIFDNAAVPYGSMDLYQDYTCVSWNGKTAASPEKVVDEEQLKAGYINRAWCRLEILSSMNIPLNSIRNPAEFTKYALKSSLRKSLRPHFVFGLRESYANSAPTLVQGSTKFIVDFNPLNGFVSVDSDKNIISLVLHKLVSLKIDEGSIKGNKE